MYTLLLITDFNAFYTYGNNGMEIKIDTWYYF